MSERHLLGVWNPDYETDAMDAHLRVLLDNIAGFRADARRLRNQLLGIGCYGDLVQLAGTRPRYSPMAPSQ